MTTKQFRALKAGDIVWFVFDGQPYENPPNVRTGTVVSPAQKILSIHPVYWTAEFDNVPHPDQRKSELTEKYVCKNGFLTKSEALVAAAGVATWWVKELRKMADRFDTWARRINIRHGAGRPSKRA